LQQEHLPGLLETAEGMAAAGAQTALQSSLQAFVGATHSEWYHSIDADLAECLKKPLLMQVHSILSSLCPRICMASKSLSSSRLLHGACNPAALPDMEISRHNRHWHSMHAKPASLVEV